MTNLIFEDSLEFRPTSIAFNKNFESLLSIGNKAGHISLVEKESEVVINSLHTRNSIAPVDCIDWNSKMLISGQPGGYINGFDP